MNFIRDVMMEERAERAFVRRFGASMLPLRRSNPRDGIVRIRDAETNSWAEYDITKARIRRVAEQEGDR